MYQTMAAPFGGNFCTSNALLTNASAAETVFDTTVTLNYCINGKAYSKTAVTDGATPTVDINTGAAFNGLTANKGSVFVWGIDKDGNVKVAQGTVEPLDASGNFITAPQFPQLPNIYTAFAYTIIKAGATTVGSWVFGTGNWNATGIGRSVVNIMMLPSRPQVA